MSEPSIETLISSVGVLKRNRVRPTSDTRGKFEAYAVIVNSSVYEELVQGLPCGRPRSDVEVMVGRAWTADGLCEKLLRGVFYEDGEIGELFILDAGTQRMRPVAGEREA